MSLNNLKNYNWEQGTLSNPVSLDSDEINGLVTLALNSSVNSDVKGYIQPIDSISSYQEWVLNTNYPNLHLVNATVVDEPYDVVFENSLTVANIYEGNQIGIIPTNIGIDGLKFRIHSHTIVTDNIATEARIKERIHIEYDRVIVDPAQENSSWSDIVIIQALPVYQEWDDGVHIPKELTLNVSAIKVSSISINAPSKARPNGLVNGNAVLSHHTKPIITTIENDGSGIFILPKLGDEIIGKGSDGLSFNFLSPSNEGNYTISCVLYAFSTVSPSLVAAPVTLQVVQPYIKFTITTDGNFSDISTANPKITLQKVDSEDEPIGEPIVLTGTVSGNSLVYTYNVIADGTEKYSVSIPRIDPYLLDYDEYVIPQNVATEINIVYKEVSSGVYILYEDGAMQSTDDYIAAGYVPLSGKTPKAALVVGNGTQFVVNMDMCIINYSTMGLLARKISGDIIKLTDIPTMVTYDTAEEAVLDFDGYNETKTFLQFVLNSPRLNYDSPFSSWIEENVNPLVINGKELEWYAAALGEIQMIKDNSTNINMVGSLVKGTSWSIPNLNSDLVHAITIPTSQTSATDFYICGSNRNGTLIMDGLLSYAHHFILYKL